MSVGIVTDTTPDWRGDTLAVDTATGDTVLQLEDVTDFDPDGGMLVIGEATARTYLSADFDADTVTLASTAGAVYEAGLPVVVWDPSTEDGNRVVQHVAAVELHDDEGGGAVEAIIPHTLVPMAGIDSLVGAQVRLEQADDEDWYVAEVLGREAVVDADTILTPYLTAYLPANVSIPNGTMTTISWGNNIRSARAVPGASFNSYIVVPRSGIYVVTANVVFEPNSSGTRYVQIVIANPDGTGERVERNSMNGAAAVGSTSVLSVKPMPLFEGERVIMQVQQNSGGALNAVGGLAYTALELTWIAAR